MARSRSRKTPSSKTQSAPRASREDVDVLDEGSSAGWETGVAVITGVVMLVAILFVDAVLGSYGSGMFFK